MSAADDAVVFPIEDFGKQVLEELLFRAATAVEAVPDGAGAVSVALQFTLRPDPEGDCLDISLPGAVEPLLLTRLPRPF